MTMIKLTRRQPCWAKFLSRFDLVISYTLDKENHKADSLTIRRPNDFLSDDNNNCQQHLLQIILLAKKLEIILIKKKINNTFVDQMI